MLLYIWLLLDTFSDKIKTKNIKKTKNKDLMVEVIFLASSSFQFVLYYSLEVTNVKIYQKSRSGNF